MHGVEYMVSYYKNVTTPFNVVRVGNPNALLHFRVTIALS